MSREDTLEDSARARARPLVAPKPYLVVVLEGDRPLGGGARFALEGIDEIVIGRGSERAAARDVHGGGVRRLTLRLPAPSLSNSHARLRREAGGWRLEDAGSKNGCYVNARRVEARVLGPEDILEVGRVFMVIRSYSQGADEAATDLDSANLAREPLAFRTLLPSLAAAHDEVRRAAGSAATILLWGETGTGKEVLARGIHALSGRPGPFVAVNCATLTDGLADSQLFGHVRGAFSGAVASTVGFIRAAHGGTLLLDEVGDLTRGAQAALLRVLQEREVVPVGGAHPQKVDVRFIATSPRPLAPAVKREQFRADLLARLIGFAHEMTPLRRRIEDIGLLVAVLLEKGGVHAGHHPRIGPEMGLDLLRHGWPMNVRELEQALARSWLRAEAGLMDEARGLHAPADEGPPQAAPRVLTPSEQEMRERLLTELSAAAGNVTQAAHLLGKGRVQVHRLMKRFGIDPKAFR